MSVYPLFMVLGSDGTLGAYAREDILKADLAQNFKAGEPARVVYKLEQAFTVSYAPTDEYSEWTEPLENLCNRHKTVALPRPTRSTCVECDRERK